MLRKARLELARCHEFPEGSTAHGYELTLPLKKDGSLDSAFWQQHRREATFRRFWGDEEAIGHLAHGRQGWSLAFDDGSGEAEVIFKAEAHRFLGGEYVSIKERDGVTRTFRIATLG